jgi:hypothetical protein
MLGDATYRDLACLLLLSTLDAFASASRVQLDADQRAKTNVTD